MSGMFKNLFNQIHFIINVTCFFPEICLTGTPGFMKWKIELLKINIISQDGTLLYFFFLLSFSGKRTCALNKIDVMGMKKVHMMSFCPTGMAHLLTADVHSVKLLVPLCNVLISLEVKKEQRDVFLMPKSMFILHALAGLKKPFQKQFLKALNTDQFIDIDVYRINSTFAKSFGTIIKVILSPEYMFLSVQCIIACYLVCQWCFLQCFCF